MSAEPSNLSKIMPFLRPYRGRLAWLVALTVILSILVMLPPLVMRAIIDKVLTGGPEERHLFVPLAICMIALPIVMSFFRYAQTLGIAYLGQRFVFDVRLRLYSHFQKLSLRFYGKHSVGKLVNRLMGDSGTVQQMLTAQSINVISDVVCAAFAIFATLFINWRLATFLVLLITVFVLNYRFNMRRIRKASKGARMALDRMSGGVQNRLVANLAVKTFGAEPRENQEFRGHLDATLGLGKEAMIASNTFQMNTQLVQGLGRSAIYFLGCAMILRGDLSYGDVVAFTAYAMQLLGPAVRFSSLSQQLQNVSIATERLFEILAEMPEVENAPHATRVKRLAGAVDFRGVHFHYDEGKPVIEGIDLQVAAGETIALIGPTGCGKSTILSLILRFYDVCGGSLLMDGIDIRKIDLGTLRRQFGIVLQESLLFNVSILENIRYSRPSASRSEIEDAAKVAEIHDFITSLPDGYATILGDKGVEISLGQKQRITIARAVVADPAILIMDEATSALDSDSEHAIQIAMDRVLKGRTSFIVAHRLSTIRNADRIVLVDRGKIVEIGNHEELMGVPEGRYRDLYLKHVGAGVLEE